VILDRPMCIDFKQIRIRNLTKIPTEQLCELTLFAQPSDVTDVLVTFQYRRDYRGKAYSDKWAMRKSPNRIRRQKKPGAIQRPDIVIAIRKEPRGPSKIENRNDRINLKRGYLPSTEYTQTEAILHYLAHEMRHLWQTKGLKSRRVWAPDQFNERTGVVWNQLAERDCDAYAISVVRHWRRAGSPFYGTKGEVKPAESRGGSEGSFDRTTLRWKGK
jgi:hypothetical protein